MQHRGRGHEECANDGHQSSARPCQPEHEATTSTDDWLALPAADVDRVEQARVFEALFPSAEAEPVRMGRFELLHRLGRGGMGEVYVAYDERLDRRVALKLLLRERSTDDQARERMLREAQVLARLSHPNVVQIYEAGIFEEQVFLAMELVDGITLREWLGAPSEGAAVRPWTEVLPVMLEAGQGLAAAHAAGLTHRDFKPDNVLVGRDGRIRVLDFGLARPGGELCDASTAASHDDHPTTESSTSSLGSDRSGAPSLGSRRNMPVLTQPGAIVGTVAYMSPEHLDAGPLGPHSDQFSFCVTLYEAFYGCRPFRGPSPMALAVAFSGPPERPASSPRIPGWLRAVVLRGLSISPELRFPDMDALLRELSRPRGRAAKVAMVAGGLLLGGIGMGSLLSRPPAPCTEADADLAMRWSETSREATRAAFARAAPEFGARVADRVVAALDPRIEAWRTEQRDACEDTRIRQTHTEDQLAQRMACIERNTTLVRALVEGLSHADAGMVEHAMDAVVELPEPTRCQDLDALGPDVPGDPAAVQAVREDVARATVRRLAGHDVEARAEIDALLPDAEATGDPLVHAEALLEAARVRMASPRPHDPEHARELLWQALDLAEPHQDIALRFEIWRELLDVDRGLGHLERARLWLRRAEVAAASSPGEPQRRLALALYRGVLELDAGDVDASEQSLRRALAEADDIPGSESWRAKLHDALGNTLRRSGRGPEARQVLEQAQVWWQAHLGPEHPYLARNAFNLGLLLSELGRLDEAHEQLERARMRWIELHGPNASLVGRAELALAGLEQARGALDEALTHVTRGQQIMEAALPADDPMLVEALQVLGLVQFRRGQLGAAHDAWQRALAGLLATRSADDPDVLLTRSNVAEALLGLGDHERAHSSYLALLPAAEAHAKQDPTTLILVHKGLGLTALGAADYTEAASRLRVALELLDRHAAPALERADVEWGLARAQRGAGAPIAAVRELAEAAARLYVEHGQLDRSAEIEAWLAGLPD